MEELIKEAQNGSEEAFSQIIISMECNLYKIAKMRLDCEDDINEAVQETIIQTFKSIKKIKEPYFFKTWIKKVLINNCNKIYRKRKNSKIMQYNDNEEKIIDIEANNSIEKLNSNVDFFFLIKKLNYNERMALTLYYLEDLSTKEISIILKESESTIRNRISRARNRLKELINGGVYNG